TGQPSLNLLKMARTELLASLRTTVHAAKKENKSIERRDLHFEIDGQQLTVDIEVVPLNPKSPSRERTFLVLFKENRYEGEEGANEKKISQKKRGAQQRGRGQDR